MYNNKYVSIKEIANKIKRGKVYKDIPFESIIDYTVDVLKLIMSEKYFIIKPARMIVENHKTTLPCDFELMIQCFKVSTNGQFDAMRYATDSLSSMYHVLNSSDVNGCNNNSNLTYSINNSIITTNFKDGQLFLVYRGINVDKEGLPLVPDEVNVKLAVEYYIKYNYLDDIGSDEQIIERRKHSDEQQYCWYVGKAQSASTNMSLDEMESFANSMSQLFTNEDQFKERYINLGLQEYRKIQ